MEHIWDSDRPSIIYEVYIPRRHEHTLKFVLDSLFVESRFARIPEVLIQPAVKQSSDSEEKRQAAIHELFRRCQSCITGYTLYDVRGRFVDDKTGTIIDEDSVVARLIVADLDCDVPRGANQSVLNDAQKIVEILITERLAAEAPDEQQIWFVKYQQSRLWRCIRKPQQGQDPNPAQQRPPA